MTLFVCDKLCKVLCACVMALAAVAFPVAVFSAQPESFDPFAAGIEDNINHPKPPQKQKEILASAMQQLERTLRELGYRTTRVRSGEVVMVTIPCSTLFDPNSVELRPKASATLSQLLPYIKRSDNYKVIVAVHADNTGDEEYSDRITADRANAIDEYFVALNGKRDTGLIPYGLGADEPVAPNTGVRNRAANRRVEIYFVPTSSYIDKIRNR